MTGPLLTAEEVAEMIGMTPDYVYALSRRGAIPTITFGRQRRYRRESIEQWLIELEAATMTRRTKRPRTADTAGGMAQEE